jgi:predicted dehydrogenase
MLRIAVAGAGAFGRNHLRVYRELEAAGRPVILAAVVEPDAVRAAEASEKYSLPVFPSIEKLLSAGLGLDAASVAVPTIGHHEAASALLEAGLDLLVEKPIAATLEQADALIDLAQARGRILQPGHLERFNPAVLAVEPQLRRPMFFEAHRLSVFTPRALDVDVVLDLMIHDLDIVLTFASSPVREVRAVGLPILSPRVDIANARVEFQSGCVANFTASRVSTERVRKLRFFEPRQYVSIDYARRDLLVIRLDGSVPPEIAAALEGGKLDPALLGKLEASGGAQGPGPGLSFVKPPVNPGEPLRLEIESFLESVRTRRPPRVTAPQSREALALALEIQAAMAAHAQRAGLKDFFAPRSY